VTEQTRCPNPDCRHVAPIEPRQLGRGTTCPRCGRNFTARPLAIWDKLEQRERDLGAGDLTRFERENRSERAAAKAREEVCYQPPPEGDPHGALLARDPMYEASVDRDAALLPPCDLVAVLDDVRSQWNVGSIFRTADGSGWTGLSLAGITAVPPNRIVMKTALGAEQYVPWRYHASVVDALEERRREGYELIALEQTKDAVSVFELEPPRRAALLLGNEVVGASAEGLALCARRVQIPMSGRKASLNVAVAFGVAAFALAAAWRRRFLKT
jgi:tRNA(Leu) C34 or U34 (ribose-2'-O)-methylase TrmL